MNVLEQPVNRSSNALRNALTRLAHWFVWLTVATLWLWSLLALWFFPAWPVWFQILMATVWIGASVAWCRKVRGLWKPLGIIAGFLILRGIWEFNRPSNDRNWLDANQRLVSAEFSGDLVRIHNFRNSHWRTKDDADIRWEDRTFNLARIQSVDFIVAPFGPGRIMAHSFLTFGFDDGRHVAISVEIRKERGESFSPVRGLFRNYEMIYVVGEETDLIGLRTHVQQDPVYLFPIRTPVEKVRALFTSMLDSANRLASAPEFYNTAVNTCHLQILRHVNSLRKETIGLDWRNYFPAHADELAWQLGLINFDGSLEEARSRFQINSRSAMLDDPKEWSRQIRQTAP